jgi:ABC-type transporter Mla MlaB component
VKIVRRDTQATLWVEGNLQPPVVEKIRAKLASLQSARAVVDFSRVERVDPEALRNLSEALQELTGRFDSLKVRGLSTDTLLALGEASKTQAVLEGVLPV